MLFSILYLTDTAALYGLLRTLLVCLAVVAVVATVAAFGGVVVALVQALALPALLIGAFAWVTYPRSRQEVQR